MNFNVDKGGGIQCGGVRINSMWRGAACNVESDCGIQCGEGWWNSMRRELNSMWRAVK